LRESKFEGENLENALLDDIFGIGKIPCGTKINELNKLPENAHNPDLRVIVTTAVY
jgi:hypothetical protein